MIDISKIKLDKISSEKVEKFFTKWGVLNLHSSGKARRLKIAINLQVKKILRNHCDSLIALYPKVKKEYEKRLKSDKKLKHIYSLIPLKVNHIDTRERNDPFSEEKFSPKFIDHKVRSQYPLVQHRHSLKYYWSKWRNQYPFFKCKICGKELYSAEEREQHAKETDWTHNDIDQLNWPVLAEHPHYICRKCKSLLPVYYVKKSIKENKGICYCVFCDFKGKEEELKFEDPFYDEQFPRICLNCLNEYKLHKTRWYAQGLLCSACKEKEETHLKNLKRSKNTP